MGFFIHGVVAVLIFLQIFFGRDLELPSLGIPEKNVVHLYRSTRHMSHFSKN